MYARRAAIIGISSKGTENGSGTGTQVSFLAKLISASIVGLYDLIIGPVRGALLVQVPLGRQGITTTAS